MPICPLGGLIFLTLIIIIGLLLCMCFYLIQSSANERRDLLNRVMARDYLDYIGSTKQPTGPSQGRNFITRNQKEQGIPPYNKKPPHDEVGDE